MTSDRTQAGADRKRQRRLRVVSLLVAVVVGALPLAACTGAGSHPASNPAPDPTAGSAGSVTGAARPVDFTAPRAADGSASHPNQYLFDVAARGSTVVAVGADRSDNIGRALFLTSADAGSHWTRVGPGSSGSPGRTADEYPNQVGVGPTGFLATGWADGVPQVWASSTGRDWRPISVPSGTFTTEDSINALTATATGWILAGTHDGAVGRGLADVIVWTSPDGSHWSRHALSTLGVRFPTGTASVASVATIGRTWVIAGGIEDNADRGQPDRLAFWRSTDAGTHWSQDPTAADLGGGYRAYAEQLITVGTRFALLAQGSISRTDNGWDAVWLTNDAGRRSWGSGFTLGGWGTKADEYPAGVVHAGGRWVVFGSTGQSPSDARISAGPTLQDGQALPGPGLGGVRDQSANGAAAVGSDVVVVGSSAAGGSDTPVIWREHGGRISQIAVPASATAGRAYVVVDSVVAAGSGLLAAGSTSTSAVAWSSADGRSWRGTELAGRTADVDSVEVSGLAVSGDGTAVVGGTIHPARGSRAAVWLKRPDDRSFRVVSAATFLSPVKDDYGFYATDAVAAGPRGFVLAGTHEADGHQDLALWFSEDGSRWQHADGAGPVPLSADDKRDNRSPWQGFRAPANGSIRIDAVHPVGSGFVAAGSITTGGRSRIAVWSSDDGKVWSNPSVLDLPAGIRAADTARLVSGGRLVLTAIGYARPGARGQLVSWVSDSGGSGWQRGTPVEGASQAGQVIAVPGGYLAAGEAGPLDDRDAAAWTSLDGQEWKRVALPLPRASGPGNQAITDLVRRGDQVLIIGQDQPPTGGGYYAVSVPLPKP